MDDIWERLESFLQKNAPPVYESLAPRATEAEIADAEEVCGFSFPADVRASYLRHDGQADEGQGFIPGYFTLLPLSQMQSEWEAGMDDPGTVSPAPEGNRAGPGVKPVYLSPAWIPFAGDIGGNSLCLDFDPAPAGVIGQIVEFDHEAYGGQQRCLAPSFRDWLGGIVGDLEAGRLVWDEEMMGYEYPEGEEVEGE